MMDASSVGFFFFDKIFKCTLLSGMIEMNTAHSGFSTHHHEYTLFVSARVPSNLVASHVHSSTE